MVPRKHINNKKTNIGEMSTFQSHTKYQVETVTIFYLMELHGGNITSNIVSSSELWVASAVDL